MRTRAAIVYVTCCLVWGSTWAAIKVGLEDLPPFLFGGARMLLAAVLLVPLVLWRRGRGGGALRLGSARTGVDREGASTGSARAVWRTIAFVGLLQLGISYALIFFAQQHLDSGFAAVLFSSFPIWAAVCAHLMLPDEPLSWKKGLAAALGLSGIVVLEWPALKGLSAGGAWQLAALLPVLAAGISAYANVTQKKHLAHVPAALNLCVQALVGAVLLLSLHFVFESDAAVNLTARAIGSVVYLALFGTVITFLCLFWLLPRIPMVAIGVIPLVDTMIAVLLGTAVLGEALGWRLAAGGALVLAGAFAANRPEPRPARVRSDPGSRETAT